MFGSYYDINPNHCPPTICFQSINSNFYRCSKIIEKNGDDYTDSTFCDPQYDKSCYHVWKGPDGNVLSNGVKYQLKSSITFDYCENFEWTSGMCVCVHLWVSVCAHSSKELFLGSMNYWGMPTLYLLRLSFRLSFDFNKILLSFKRVQNLYTFTSMEQWDKMGINGQKIMLIFDNKILLPTPTQT